MFSPPSTIGKLLRVAVLLLWQCPLPLFHSHGTSAAEGGQDPWLASHLRQFHPDALASRTVCDLGWHCHLLTPTGLPSGDPENHVRDQGRFTYVAASPVELRAAADGESPLFQPALAAIDPPLSRDAFRAEAAWRAGDLRSVLDDSRQQRATVLRC